MRERHRSARLTGIDVIARIVGRLLVILNEVVQKRDQVVALVEEKLTTRNVRVNGPQVIVVGKGVQVHSGFYRVKLVQEIDRVLRTGEQ